ncbi:hypothetical protein CHUV2995_00141 [Corynebacterium diphtheriae subsp. lausannense]|nr:hypothetical protein CHUV2995_00141 [Corynebacterium diphtheriae subsp. lausannense]STC65534.1 Uncharacterised protein [Corynebacterium diphtheriae]
MAQTDNQYLVEGKGSFSYHSKLGVVAIYCVSIGRDDFHEVVGFVDVIECKKPDVCIQIGIQ